MPCFNGLRKFFFFFHFEQKLRSSTVQHRTISIRNNATHLMKQAKETLNAGPV